MGSLDANFALERCAYRIVVLHLLAMQETGVRFPLGALKIGCPTVGEAPVRTVREYVPEAVA